MAVPNAAYGDVPGRPAGGARTHGGFIFRDFFCHFFLLNRKICSHNACSREKKSEMVTCCCCMHAGLLIPSIWLGGNQPVTATATQQACRAETQRMSQERPLKWCGRSAMLLFFFVFYLQLGRPPNRSMHRRENKEQALPKAGRQGAPMLHRCSCTTRGLCQPPGCHVLLPQQHSIRVSSQPRTRGVDLSARLHATAGAAAARCSGDHLDGAIGDVPPPVRHSASS